MPENYTLYGSPDSANLVIRILLKELDQRMKTIWLNRAKQEHQSTAFRALNPQGLMPVLVDDGQPIFETAAIALYLTDKHGALAPQSGTERTRFLQWLFYLSNTLHADLRAKFNCGNYIDGEAEQSALHSGISRRIQRHLVLIEAELARNESGSWFLGECVSVLDFYLGALCRWWQLYPLGNTAGPISQDVLPRIHRLLHELADRPSVVAACTEERINAPYFLAPSPPDLPADQIVG